MKNKILVLGRGYIGTRIYQELKCAISDEKIYSYLDAQRIIKKFKPSVIINSIGYIGRNVDDCELNIDKSLISNTFVPLILAEAALRNGIRLIHISSGCIFHFNYKKDKPIHEERTPDFFDLFYSRTKMYSEQALKILSEKYPILIVRIRIPLDNRPHPKNLLSKLLRFSHVIDIPNSVTYIPDFLKALRHLIRIKADGIYHVVNKGALRYPQLLDEYKKHVSDFNYRVINYKELRLVRTNLVLSTKKLEESGFKVRDIHEALPECVKGYVRWRKS